MSDRNTIAWGHIFLGSLLMNPHAVEWMQWIDTHILNQHTAKFTTPAALDSALAPPPTPGV